MSKQARSAVARAYSLCERHGATEPDGVLRRQDWTPKMLEAHNDWDARQRQLWDLEHELERLDAVLARTNGRKRGGALNASQADWVRSGVEADAAPLRAKIAALRQVDELVMGRPTLLGSDDPAADWELLWRLRSLRGPINWSIRRESPTENPMPVAQAASILGAEGDTLPAGVRRLLGHKSSATGAARLNALVAEAVTEARARRKPGRQRRSA